MISWMQKNNKFLVWTIWVATIAFIGSGIGSFGNSKAGNVARVGEIDISQKKLNLVYSNLYGQYNQVLNGKLDDKKAKEMGLPQRAFASLERQAKLLNFANEIGLTVSDSELSKELTSIESFQKDGKFEKQNYTNYLQGQGIKAKDFESTIKDELLVRKVLALFKSEALATEINGLSTAMNVADKLAYKVLTTTDIEYSSDPSKAKEFWESTRENYMTAKTYSLSLVWTNSDNQTVSEDESKVYYEANSFNYTDTQGKQLSYENAKESVNKALKLKKSKKDAQKDYIAFKKNNKIDTEDIMLPLNDSKLTKDIWELLNTSASGDILKPKIIGNQYVTIKVNTIQEARVMNYDEAKEKVTLEYDTQTKKKNLFAHAKMILKNINASNSEVSDFITLVDNAKLNALNSQENSNFSQKLFASDKEKGIISINDKLVVFQILEQKILKSDENQTDGVEETVKNLKQKIFDNNLFKLLDTKYPTQTYVKGLIK